MVTRYETDSSQNTSQLFPLKRESAH